MTEKQKKKRQIFFGIFSLYRVLKVDILSVADFVATVYRALGLDPKAEYNAQGRPMTMLPKGSAVDALF
mgnify:CR=1 FL=1